VTCYYGLDQGTLSKYMLEQ